MDRRDLRSVLRLFAEIASSMNHDESASAPDHRGAAQSGAGCLPLGDDETWEEPSTAAQ